MAKDPMAAVAAARSRVETATTVHARAEAAAEAAGAEAQRVLARLREEFGVASVAEARELLASWDKQIAEQVGIVEDSLRVAEAD